MTYRRTTCLQRQGLYLGCRSRVKYAEQTRKAEERAWALKTRDIICDIFRNEKIVWKAITHALSVNAIATRRNRASTRSKQPPGKLRTTRPLQQSTTGLAGALQPNRAPYPASSLVNMSYIIVFFCLFRRGSSGQWCRGEEAQRERLDRESRGEGATPLIDY